MKRVVIESPYGGDISKNTAYLNRCMLDCLQRNEAPFASHGLYPSALDERNPAERELGIEAGYAWGAMAEAVIFYVDYGWSRGMELALERYSDAGAPYEVRRLYNNSWKPDSRTTQDDIQRTL